jgi:hypothetical protein
MRFSDRYGYKKPRELIQVESIDEPLKNGLWSILKLQVWDTAQQSTGMYGGYYISASSNKELHSLCEKLWFHFFRSPLDNLDSDWLKVLSQLREYFFSCKWYEVYDFLEFVADNFQRYQFKDRFTGSCNALLEREVSAYRFVNGQIVRITEKEQLDEVERALENARGPVRMHLSRALELLADRQTPDYRNSIKESISAIESLVAATVGIEKGTLGQLIKTLEDSIGLHPALRAAFSNLYGYTSDAGGIRHALLEADTVTFADAKFFLVVCSAFVSFVESKMSNAGEHFAGADA